ncbi:hypothetical protein V8C42DRAFT_187343 [Trichoderma barbatum]
MQSLIALFLALAGTSIAVPAQRQPVSQLVPVPVPGVPVPDYDPVDVPAPPVDITALNGTKFPADAAFECVKITLGGHGKVGMTTIDGLCRNSANEWWKTSLNLNECIGNAGGKLVYEADGGFDATCRPCIVDSFRGGDNMNLKCNCLDEKRLPWFTALEIGSSVKDPLAIKLIDGRFVCGNKTGSKDPTFV